jgi:uncharacterized membrane protein HdeD (DUF308 family)
MAATAPDVRIVEAERLSPRAILRLNGLAAILVGSLILIVAGPIAGAFRMGHRALPAVAGLILLLLGSDELMFAVGRRLRRLHVRLFALADAALVAGGAFLIATGTPSLAIFERVALWIVAVTVAPFAVAAFRASREL